MMTVRETLTERIYEPEGAKGWRISSVQQPGDAKTMFMLLDAPEEGWWFIYGTDAGDLHKSCVGEDGVAYSSEKIPPGCLTNVQVFNASCDAVTPLLQLHTICRYPYGREFHDYFEEMTQHPGQSRVIDYDLEYYSTDASLDGIRLRVRDTDPKLYIDHIIASVTDGQMSNMEKAKAIWTFVSRALQHNAIHMNLRETVPALDGFYNDPGGDFDALTMLLLELGHTRCGVINGFVSAALLKRVGIPLRVAYACGGHTGGIATIGGKDRIWDPDAFKDGIPLDENGDIPEYDWVRQPENIFLLDTKPSWADNPAHEGWLRSHEGYRISGYIDGGRYHSETGYASSWHGAPKAYPPRPPELLPVLWRKGSLTRLEWLGSYDRDGDFKDYLARVYSPDGSLYLEQATDAPYIEVELPVQSGYSFTAIARDRHAEGTPYYSMIDYTAPPSIAIPDADISLPYPWDMLWENEAAGRSNLLEGENPLEYIEGRDNVLGQTKFAQTNLWRTECAKIRKPIFRMVDETSSLFSGVAIRSLFAGQLPQAKTNAEGWRFTAVMRITPYDIAGYGKFPMVWLGSKGSHIGAGIGLDCKKGLVCAACNIMGDWRYFDGFEPVGFSRFDIVCEPGVKRLRYYVNNILFSTQDYTMFHEGSFDVDTVYVSGNPEAETGYLISDLLV